MEIFAVAGVRYLLNLNKQKCFIKKDQCKKISVPEG